MHLCHQRLQRSEQCGRACWVLQSCHAAMPRELLSQCKTLVLEPLLTQHVDLGLK